MSEEGINRREMLQAMAAAAAMAALAGCDGPPEEAIPYVEQPEGVLPDRARRYATAIPFAGYVQPVLAEVRSGRPTRLDGNPQHPLGTGPALDIFTQAAVLGLYDPDRSSTVMHLDEASTWEAAAGVLAAMPPRLRLLSGPVGSPTALRLIEQLLGRHPEARWYTYQPVTTDVTVGGAVLHYRLAHPQVIVSIGADLFGPGPHQLRHLAEWAENRRSGRLPRLHVVEPTGTTTGSAAFRREAVAGSRLAAVAVALAAELGIEGAAAPRLSPTERAWVDGAAADLAAAGGDGLLAVGADLGPDLHRLCYEINRRLGAVGRGIVVTEPIALAGQGGLAELARDIEGGGVDALLIFDSNPVYAAPAGMAITDLLGRVPLRLHAGLYFDETAALCQWHLPLRHALESWDDGRAVEGTVTVQQPTVTPLRDGRTVPEILAMVLGESRSAIELVRETWSGRLGSDAAWRQALHDGFIAGTAAPSAAVASAPMTLPVTPAEDGLELVFQPDPSIWDGRFANNAWLQELPKPMTKLTWDNVAVLGGALAAELGIEDGRLIEIAVGESRLVAPAWIMPWQAAGTVTLFFGYGRRRAGRVGTGAGYDAFALWRGGPWRGGAAVRVLDGSADLATTQPQQREILLEGYDFVKVVAPGEAPQRPDLPKASLYPDWPYEGRAWGMVVDLDLCTGCNACVIACQAENNVPTVGKQQVAMGREMHWLRIDTYWMGEAATPEIHFLPVPCMHCEKAPCELGCPVNATVHGPEGLNQMIYNRCIGTRTCSSYCPYKVRRFNWYDYTDRENGRVAQRNPEVTVRARGVMEKCTYCVQRIARARIDAKTEDRPIRDGEVTTACQDACPARAIHFGDLNDPEAAVTRARADRRNYALLEHLDTRPRTTYLAALRTPPKGA